MAYEHGGISPQRPESADERERVLDFSASINPLGPPDFLRQVISRALDDVEHYPDPAARELIQALARQHALPEECLAVGNGSTELIYALARALKPKRTLLPIPSYHDYAAAAALAGSEVAVLPLRAERNFSLDCSELESRLRDGDLVFLGQPNNPTGQALAPEDLRSLLAAHPGVMFAVDESFADFTEPAVSLLPALAPNLAVLRSLTKFYAIPGLRLGFAAAAPELAARWRKQLPPWSVNSLAQAVGAALFESPDYAQRTRALIQAERPLLQAGLARLPRVTVYPGAANFLLARLDDPALSAQSLAERLRARGVWIRACANFPGLDPSYFRVAVRTRSENDRLLEALARELNVPAAPGPRRTRRARALMIQGTSSYAGKSVLTAALGRILLQDGVRVAPFKSQNMSLNSFVTADGGEMGRAQAVQAQACRLEPDVRMNPILLKPSSDTVAQVIVRGKPVQHMDVPGYFEYQRQAFPVAQACYDSLAAEHDVMLLEGAGSPGEVNLREHDIVNMRMAEYADAAVLVVGDIDRGGVFASFVGTAEVLHPAERRRLAGWIVNRFRGDARLLASALDYTLRHTGKPVLGVIPYLPDLMIPEEDGVDFQRAYGQAAPRDQTVEIAVLDLPHISNFTDLDAFRLEDDVRLTLVRRPEDLGQPEAVIIPGSKNTLADLESLRQRGLAARLLELHAAGYADILGVCAGFQMLGREISDPQALESPHGRAAGLGLLDLATVLREDKILSRTTARHVLSGLPVFGYEIHHGQTPVPASQALFTSPAGAILGAVADDHRVWGTYVHGVFDADDFRRWFVDRLRAKRGWAPRPGPGTHYSIEPALDRLAGVVRQHLDMEKIYRLLGRA